MGSVIDTASGIMRRAERNVEIASQNVSNLNTVGYKRKVGFQSALDSTISRADSVDAPSVVSDFAPGKLIDAGGDYNIALAGAGFFVVASDKGAIYTRQGQFEKDASGRLVNAQGQSLQVEGGGDLKLRDGPVKILQDGSVLEGGVPVGKLAVVAFDPAVATAVEGGGYTAPNGSVAAVERPSVHQGKLESSNVSLGAEMVAVMGALRRAETGQRLATVYDDLMGRVLQSFGQAG